MSELPLVVQQSVEEQFRGHLTVEATIDAPHSLFAGRVRCGADAPFFLKAATSEVPEHGGEVWELNEQADDARRLPAGFPTPRLLAHDSFIDPATGHAFAWIANSWIAGRNAGEDLRVAVAEGRPKQTLTRAFRVAARGTIRVSELRPGRRLDDLGDVARKRYWGNWERLKHEPALLDALPDASSQLAREHLPTLVWAERRAAAQCTSTHTVADDERFAQIMLADDGRDQLVDLGISAGPPWVNLITLAASAVVNYDIEPSAVDGPLDEALRVLGIAPSAVDDVLLALAARKALTEATGRDDASTPPGAGGLCSTLEILSSASALEWGLARRATRGRITRRAPLRSIAAAASRRRHTSRHPRSSQDGSGPAL